MFKFKNIFVFILLILITTSCSNKQNINVQKLNDNGNYEDFNVISKANTVSIVREILNKVKWETMESEMEREADYLFYFQFVNPDIEAKPVLYSVWINPNKDSLEVTQGDTKYVHLNADESAKLYKAITDTNLSDIK
ncbi:hypothetical protein KDN24_06445 [Bacillus sp. Bva_UNVM-123]|uniref:hypothetical protein n=1 Tax=Bacillus sp. Bva_UNVM-123 TaxID=2829798 RepID=UPI00391F0C03